MDFADIDSVWRKNLENRSVQDRPDQFVTINGTIVRMPWRRQRVGGQELASCMGMSDRQFYRWTSAKRSGDMRVNSLPWLLLTTSGFVSDVRSCDAFRNKWQDLPDGQRTADGKFAPKGTVTLTSGGTNYGE